MHGGLLVGESLQGVEQGASFPDADHGHPRAAEQPDQAGALDLVDAVPAVAGERVDGGQPAVGPRGTVESGW